MWSIARPGVAERFQGQPLKRVALSFAGRTQRGEAMITRDGIEGGLIYGLTAVLHGDITVDKGRVVESNFHDYVPLRIDAAPVMEVFIIKSDAAPGGIGEPGTTSVAPAVVNAIAAATGVRLRRLPVDAKALVKV